ncbi:quinolinate synthase NadA [Methanococcoides burtonii]|uniref:Quinolinate synthase n=1 Tax=Methanococcoides burtonii (strain DSM 6242 / NBRC 107633 / OCM 468 / ACE-M) TaxID=259564 RepID=Q12Y91_METBU|nr:quinolinate synthase NadA [Methanococcoides burtonii]ABE51585.1 Quinolinate synthetase A [Methanococcoides burtonii DSM 6242]
MQDMKKIIERINILKTELDAVILAHNYQRPEVQDIADFTGDSLGLSQQVVNSDADVIVFCGVDFMAESAAILSPEKIVLLPEKDAGCPMAEMVDVISLDDEKKKHPDAAVVCYVNSSALIKAQSDICCTSANAIDVVNSLEEDEVIFVPDKNLGNYVAGFTDKMIYSWDGFCPTHHQMRGHDVIKAKEEHPDALFLAHPECRTEVLDLADEVLSTTGMLNYAKKSDAKEFIIGTENGLLHRLSKENPEKKLYYVSEFTICTNMKITTLESVLDALENMQYVITVPEDTRLKAKEALDRMLAVKRTM